MIFSFFKALLAGMVVSFLGQLPLGNVNIAVTQLSIQEGYKQAWKFAFGLAAVEIVYLRLALSGIEWVVQNRTLFIFLGWLSVVLFFVLGIASLWAARKQAADRKGLIIDNKIDRFWLGVSVCAINPVQIPFWFTWSLYLVNTKILLPTNSQYNIFIIGAGIGSLAGLAVYMYGGKWALKKINANNRSLNRFMGIVLIIVAILQCYKLIYEPWNLHTN